jgi:hypothetical protein
VYFNGKLYARTEKDWENGYLVVIDPIALKTEEDNKVRLQISHLIPKDRYRQSWISMNKHMPLLTDGKNTSLFIVTAVVEEHKRVIAPEDKEEYDNMMKEIINAGPTKEAIERKAKEALEKAMLLERQRDGER